MKTEIRIYLLFLLFCLSSTLEPCEVWYLDAEGLSEAAKDGDPRVFTTMGSLASTLRSVIDSDPACKELGIIVYPGTYTIINQISFVGYKQDFSLIFNTSDIADPPTRISFNTQSVLRFYNLSTLEFQNMTFAFYNSSLEIVNTVNVNFTNVNMSESQINNQGNPKILIQMAKFITFRTIEISWLLSPNFLEINCEDTLTSLINITNLTVMYAPNSKDAEIFLDLNNPRALSINAVNTLTITNFSVVSPRNTDAPDIPIQTAVLSKVLSVLSAEEVSIVGFYATNINSWFYRDWCKFESINRLSLERIILNRLAFDSTDKKVLFDIKAVKKTSIQDVIFFNNSLRSDRDSFHIFEFTSPEGIDSEISINKVHITDKAQAAFFTIAGQFQYFNVSNVTAANIELQNSIIFDACLIHENLDIFNRWFGKKETQFNLENMTFEAAILKNSKIMRFCHQVANQSLTSLMYGEGIVANLKNISFSKITASQVGDATNNSLVHFDGVKGYVSQFRLIDSTFNYMNFLYSRAASSLIVQNLSIINTEISRANVIHQEPIDYTRYGGEHVTYRTEVNRTAVIYGLPLYRVLSIQESTFQNVSLRQCILASTNSPFFVFANNIFANSTIAEGAAITSTVAFGVDAFQYYKLDILLTEKTVFGSLVGPEIQNFKDIFSQLMSEEGYFSLIYGNSFSGVNFISIEDKVILLPKRYEAPYNLIFQANNFTAIRGANNSYVTFIQGFNKVFVTQNQISNFKNISTGFFVLQSIKSLSITKNEFGYSNGGSAAIKVLSDISSQGLYFIGNKFISLFVNDTSLVSLDMSIITEMRDNYFSNCSLSVGIVSALFEIVDSVIDLTLKQTIIFRDNNFEDTSVVRLRSATKRSALLRIKADYATFNISRVVFSNALTDLNIQNLAVLEANVPSLILNEISVLGYRGEISNFGNFIHLEAADIQIMNCTFDNITFISPDITQDNFMYISTFDERSMNVSMKNTKFTKLVLQSPTFLRSGWAPSLDLTFSNCYLEDITHENKLFDLAPSQINTSFIGGMIFYSVDSEIYSERTAFSIEKSGHTLNFHNTIVVFGTPAPATFIKCTGNLGGQVLFSKSLFLTRRSFERIFYEVRNDTNQTNQNMSSQISRFLESSRLNGEDLGPNGKLPMKLLSIQGSHDITFNDTLLDFEGSATPPPVFATSANFSLNILNTTFKNMEIIPDAVSSRATYADYFDENGRYLGGLVNAVINPSNPPSSQGSKNQLPPGGTVNIKTVGSSFGNFKSNSTGVFSILNQNPKIPFALSIANSSFDKLNAKYGPVATLLLPNIDGRKQFSGNLSIVDSSIDSSNAELLGGAIFNNMSQNITIFSVNTSNTHMNAVGNLLYDTTGDSSGWNISQLNNTLTVGAPTSLNYTISVDPKSGVQISPCADNSNFLCLHNASSFSLLSIQINVTIFDSNSVLFPDPSETAALTFNYFPKQYSQFFKCSFGSCLVDKVDLVMTGKANETLNFTLSYNSEYASLSNVLRVTLRGCIMGEHNDTSNGICNPCPSGNYSLNPVFACKPCPANATCKGGAYIAPMEGFWRPNTTTDVIHKCIDSQGRCLGEYYSNCSKGYKGPLCLQCDYENSYGSGDNINGCYECPKKTWLLIAYRFGLWVLPFLYAIYVFSKQKALNERVLQEENNETVRNTLKQALYIDLLITYSQIMGIVLTFKRGFKELLSILGGGGAGASSAFLFYPEVCLYLDAKCTGCVSASFSLLTPVIQWFLLSFYYFVFVYRFKLTWKRFRRFLLIGVTFYLLYYPSVCDKLIKLLYCTDFGLPGADKIVYTDPNVSCTSPEYLSFIRYIAIPALAVWSVGIPSLIIIGMRCFKNHPKALRQIFGQLINPYKEDKYYWALGVLLLKFGLIIASNLSEDDSKFRALAMIIMLYLYKWLEGYLEPYADPKVVVGVRLSLYAYITTVFFSYFYTDNTDLMKIICVSVTVVMNVIGLGYILSFIITNTYNRVMTILKRLLSRCFPKLTNKLHPEIPNDQTKISDTLEISDVDHTTAKTFEDHNEETQIHSRSKVNEAL